LESRSRLTPADPEPGRDDLNADQIGRATQPHPLSALVVMQRYAGSKESGALVAVNENG
jgi:hypothetical protein